MDTSPFSVDVWRPALEKYASVTRLTVILFDRRAQIVCGPINRTPLFDAFAHATVRSRPVHGMRPALPSSTRPSVHRHRRPDRPALAVVGTPLS